MCIRRKKFQQKPSNNTLGQTGTNDLASKDDYGSKRSTIGGIHLRRKKTRKTMSAMTPQQRRENIAAAQKALGHTPNTAIVERIAERIKMAEMTVDDAKSGATKSVVRGDISWSQILKSKNRTKDDTLGPYNTEDDVQTAAKGTTEEDPAEDNEEAPTSQTYMFNEQEIVMVGHDMIRNMDAADIKDIAGDMMDLQEPVKWDPLLPLADLKSRDCFNCIALRRNTLVSNTMTMPTDEEKKPTLNQSRKVKGPKNSLTHKNEIQDIEKYPKRELDTTQSMSVHTEKTNEQPATVVKSVRTKRSRNRP